jgi:alpha/beta superfamily hydrolase
LETVDGVKLEMRYGEDLNDREGACGVAVICHPHPLHGGDMHNAVVKSLSRAARDEGYVPLLFNFRGTGRSEGSHTGGLREVDDVEAAMSKARELSNDGIVILLGYSFGAGVATKWLNGGGDADAFIGVAVPAQAEAPDYKPIPTLYVSGELDDVAPIDDGLYRAHLVDGIHVIVEDSDHLFSEWLNEVTEAVRGFISITCPVEIPPD